MDAFAKFAKKQADVYLIIIGGYGVLYRETVEYATSLPCADRIVIVRAISNPFTILRECDLFLLPSTREPLGLVLLEAATLKVPIVATDIPGSGCTPGWKHLCAGRLRRLRFLSRIITVILWKILRIFCNGWKKVIYENRNYDNKFSI